MEKEPEDDEPRYTHTSEHCPVFAAVLSHLYTFCVLVQVCDQVMVTSSSKKAYTVPEPGDVCVRSWMQYCVEYQAYALLELVSCTQKYMNPFAPTCAAVDVVLTAEPLVAEEVITVHALSHVDPGE